MAGTARGRRLRSPEGEGTRPTSDRVREAVFNALTSLGAVRDARAADLFAGSGALGIEALSRGVAACWFVERDRDARAVIEDNLVALGLGDRATVLAGDLPGAVAHLPDELDLVLADPPYAFDEWLALLRALEPKLSEDAVVVVESDRAVALPDGWEKQRERNYGGTVVTFTAPPAGTGADA